MKHEVAGLGIFAKAPVPGEVKTRLFPYLTPEQAAELHRAFVLDTLAHLKPPQRVKRYIACYPSSTDPFFKQLRQDYQMELLDQQGDDLGERMGGIVRTLMQSGCDCVVLIGTDSPTLPTSTLKDAFDALQQRPVVLGPSQDGGYYLIGFSQQVRHLALPVTDRGVGASEEQQHRTGPHRSMIPQVFEDIPWSTEKVFEITLQKIHDLGLTCEVLPQWFDVDDLNSLKVLKAQLAKQPDLASNTWAFLQSIR